MLTNDVQMDMNL
ncbi:hypothetical protein F383_30421 [Gossypium arboreum]|uniref:Uncharacterized protein n=1 Tax=Gossypium arboreum TaxID=29729 RepID=A0A0B0PIW0_GOSAR|nr:hypothetical protein F383_30421 [Gossypium arboreum]